MPTDIAADSVGLVSPQTAIFERPLPLTCGRTLASYRLVYETYGELNAARSNAILICHALSGHHHAAGFHRMDEQKPGWWDACIGPGKAIDTRFYYVVAVNNLGGCHGSTGPASINPETQERYGPDFPIMTMRDWVNSQARLADYLRIDKWHAVIGGSMGGMQALRWSLDFPQRIEKCIIIAGAAKLSAQNIAFNEVARQAITQDPDFHAGHYYQQGAVPRKGLALARMLAHITYISETGMREKFGRELKSGQLNFNYDIDFAVESYLRYQGERFSDSFDANTYLLMTKALDYFDPAADFDGDLSRCVQNTQAQFLVISFSTDWRFLPERSKEIVDALVRVHKPVSYLNIDAPQGHDAFLFPIPEYVSALRGFLAQEPISAH